MIFYFFLAILSAFCWAISSLISADITREIGGIAFNRIRLFFVSIMLIIYASYFNSWNTINYEYLLIIILSGFIGIFLGDTLLFVALEKIGPRRNNILFSLAAPFTVILNIFILKEKMTTLNIVGCFIVFFGVIIAIAFGSNNDNKHKWEIVKGSLSLGIIFAIFAALCQSVGLIIIKPVLDSGADPIASAAIRVSISFLLIIFTLFINSRSFQSPIKISFKIILKSILSGFLGMALGMSLLLIALQKADAGIVATLSSTSPIIILFLIWYLTKKIPTIGAWCGTIVAIFGTGLIFIY